MVTAVKLVIYVVKYGLQGADIGYDVHSGLLMGKGKPSEPFIRHRTMKIGSYTRYKTATMSIVPVTTGMVGLIMGIGKPYVPYIGHITVTLGLIPHRR